MKKKVLEIILWIQGVYYALTGLWAIVNLDHFSKITGHYGDPFEMHSIAALAVVLGIAFIVGALNEKYRLFAGGGFFSGRL